MSEPKLLSQKMAKLDDQINWFYSDDFSLDESAKKYQETIASAEDIRSDLDQLKNEIEVLSEDFSK